MKISQEERDYINNAYPDYIDESALRCLIQYTYCKYFTGDKFPPKKDFKPTIQWLEDATKIKENNPNFTNEELSARIQHNYRNLFLRTFPQFIK